MASEYKGKRIVIWPVYIDSKRSRKQGRRVSLRWAIKSPKIEEIVEAAKRLNLNPLVEEAAYPREWWSIRTRVIVDKVHSKSEILKMICEVIREMRESRGKRAT